MIRKCHVVDGRLRDAEGLRAVALKFAHGAQYVLPSGRQLVDSYHCSRYNTNTRRLTEDMFRDVVGRASELARSGAAGQAGTQQGAVGRAEMGDPPGIG